MRAVVQRAARASVSVGGELVSSIGAGLMVLLGVQQGDGEKDAEYIADKLANLRIFEDEEEKMNLSLLDVGGEVLMVSQFTLLGDARKGRRPSFLEAAVPVEADELYKKTCSLLEEKGIKVARGIFGEHMQVELVNDGPVTILLCSQKTF